LIVEFSFCKLKRVHEIVRGDVVFWGKGVMWLVGEICEFGDVVCGGNLTIRVSQS
jgi:hypothetical protein